MHWIVIFNLQNSHLSTLSLPTEVFLTNGQNRHVANLPVVDVQSQPREMLTTKPPNTQLSVFLLVCWFSTPSRKVWTSLSASDTDFFGVLAGIIQESSEKLLCIENSEGFAVHSSTWPIGAKGEWRVSSWLAISTNVKKKNNTIISHVCCYGFSQGRKSLYNTAV